jgi:UDP-2-acetamido-2,6-beta-L-arabino-hexul-4-ose reductase
MRVLVTGSRGFMGTHLMLSLRECGLKDITEFEAGDSLDKLEAALLEADVVYHLAGVNRPARAEEFNEVNYDLTRTICRNLERCGKKPILLFVSSIQAACDNPYGRSKRLAEEEVLSFGRRTGTPVAVYRLSNVFGKWSRPNYNTVVATFCYNAAHGIPLRVDDPDREIDFVYVEDVIKEFVSYVKGRQVPPLGDPPFLRVDSLRRITLEKLASTVEEIAERRKSGRIPDLSDQFVRSLSSMFLTYVEKEDLMYIPEKKADQRGYLVELLKSPHAGQVFMSMTKPGVTRGGHYHHTKVEKFIVVKGSAVVILEHLLTGEKHEFTVQGEDCPVVDIPPDCLHTITNVGSDDMIVLFWANEIFDPSAPDTYTTREST